MGFEFKNKYMIGIVLALAILAFDFYLYFVQGAKRWLLALIILAIAAAQAQIWWDFYQELQRQKEKELKFLEFVRSLVGNVRSGVSLPKGVLNIADEDYGSLSPHIKKLARQIEWGIPLHKALVIFANDTENVVIKRAIAIIIEADESGGAIVDILDSVATSVLNIKKMKEERKSSVFSQVLQGYIVFFVFIGIMLILQLWLFPKLEGSLQVGGGEEYDEYGLGNLGAGIGGVFKEGEKVDLDFIFFSLTLIQGFFAGIMVGKFSEGSVKQGLFHSVILMTLAALIITTAKGGI